MKIDVLCSDPDHPVMTFLATWQDRNAASHDIALVQDKLDLRGGDILFLVSCSQLIEKAERALFRHVMVLHASDLPEGRGWSPHIWDILAGKDEITLSLLVAEDAVDSGDVWAKTKIPVPRDTLYNEINDLLFAAEIDLMDQAIVLVTENKQPTPQDDRPPSYHPRRRPADSELDPSLPLEELFDQIRVADPNRFPAFFNLRGSQYELVVRKRGQSK